MRASAEERFWAKVEKTDTCWLWTASTTQHGYGMFGWDGRAGPAHRYAYEHFIGPIQNGLTIDHRCSNPRCVNPDHLEAVTPRTNVLRGRTFAAANHAKTHCPNGHPYDRANTYERRTATGHIRRGCRACLGVRAAQA